MNGTQHVLRDESLEDEIELVGELVVAATVNDGPLSQEQIDEALGLEHRDADGAPGDKDGATGPGA